MITINGIELQAVDDGSGGTKIVPTAAAVDRSLVSDEIDRLREKRKNFNGTIARVRIRKTKADNVSSALAARISTLVADKNAIGTQIDALVAFLNSVDGIQG